MKLVHLPGLHITLSSNGADLEEYEDESDEEPQPNIISRYVEAISGCNFCVHFRAGPSFGLTPPKDCLTCTVFLDGKSTISKIFDLHDRHRGIYDKSIEGVDKNVNGNRMCETFKFADLKTSMSVYSRRRY